MDCRATLAMTVLYNGTVGAKIASPDCPAVGGLVWCNPKQFELQCGPIERGSNHGCERCRPCPDRRTYQGGGGRRTCSDGADRIRRFPHPADPHRPREGAAV